MAWMMDTYSMQVGYAVPEIVTGKPISIGGSRLPARGDRRRRRDGDRARVRAARLEARRAALRRPGLRQRRRDRARASSPRTGRDRDRRLRHLRRRLRRRRARRRRAAALRRASTARSPTGPSGDRLTNEELLELPCDILVLAAREDQVTAENAPRVAGAADRRGRERADLARGRRDPRRARHPRPAGRPHERRRRDRLVLRVGAGPRAALLGPRRDPRAGSPTSWATRSTASGTLSEQRGPDAAQRRARRRDPRGRRRRSTRAGSTREPRPRRDGRRPARARRRRRPRRRRASTSSRPDVRAVSSATSGRLVGVVTRKTLVREVVAAGPRPARDAARRDRGAAALHDRRRSCRSTRRSGCSRSATLERVPVVEDGRLVGVLSRSGRCSAAWPRTSRRPSSRLSSRCRRRAARRPRRARAAPRPRARRRARRSRSLTSSSSSP